MKKQKYKIIIVVLMLSLLDQIIKLVVIANKHMLPVQIIKNIFQINYQENYGIAFGIAQGGRISFIIVNFIIIGLIAKFLFTQLDSISNTKKVCLGLIISGGIGNLIDRIFRGYVVDYLDFSKIIDYPIFNFADIMIAIGTIWISIIIIFDLFKDNKIEKEK